MSTASLGAHLTAMGFTTDELGRLTNNTGISAGFLWDLAAQTGLTTEEIANMSRGYIAVMDQMSDAAGGARTNILGMSDEHFKQYLNNKLLNDNLLFSEKVYQNILRMILFGA